MPWRPKCLSEATVGAGLAKSAAWALQSPKPSVGCCDPARLGAVARLSGRPGWYPPGPRPERGAQAGALFGRSLGFRQGARAGRVTAALPGRARGSKLLFAISIPRLKGDGRQHNGGAPSLPPFPRTGGGAHAGARSPHPSTARESEDCACAAPPLPAPPPALAPPCYPLNHR